MNIPVSHGEGVRPAMRTYRVEIAMHAGLAAHVYSAKSPSAARAAAWRDFTSAYNCTFKDFLRISRVKGCAVPKDDGYDYVRRNYDVNPKIGGRVRLANEGPSTGLEGEVVYPGISTAHVHVRIDGRDHTSIVHPFSIQIIEPQPPFLPENRRRG